MSPEPVVPLSALEHHLYCPRQCALIHVDGAWQENRATVAGVRAHRRVDTPGDRRERGRRVFRAVPLWSDAYGLSGRSDGVEVYDDGGVAPVEHKAGVRHGQAADVQLCGQALCLEEMFRRPVPEGYVWYGGTRRRERVMFDGELTARVIDEVRTNLLLGVLPPAVADQRCRACQLEAVCLPGIVAQPHPPDRCPEEAIFRCE